jgi:hypothetical protein
MLNKLKKLFFKDSYPLIGMICIILAFIAFISEYYYNFYMKSINNKETIISDTTKIDVFSIKNEICDYSFTRNDNTKACYIVYNDLKNGYDYSNIIVEYNAYKLLKYIKCFNDKKAYSSLFTLEWHTKFKIAILHMSKEGEIYYKKYVNPKYYPTSKFVINL